MQNRCIINLKIKNIKTKLIKTLNYYILFTLTKTDEDKFLFLK